jgi:predicted RNA-binding protein with PUA-like domain
MNYWLLKTEPSTYSWEDLLSDKKTVWDGIRNYQARNFMADMKKDDQVLFYHTGTVKEIVGIAAVSKEAYADPADAEWKVIEIIPVKKLKYAVSLGMVKTEKKLADMVLLRNSRLSVQPVTRAQFDQIIALSQKSA